MNSRIDQHTPDEDTLKGIAAQLRKPEGKDATDVGNMMNDGNAAMNRATIAALDLWPGAKVLELGMGNGFFIKELFSRQVDLMYTGCDFSSEMIKEANMLNKELLHAGKVEFCHANAEKLPFQDSTFDLLFSVNTLYFWENPASVFQEIRRILKPGGKLYLAIRPRHIMEKFPFTQYGFEMFEKGDVSELLTANNFIPEKITENEEAEQEIFGRMFAMSSLVMSAACQK